MLNDKFLLLITTLKLVFLSTFHQLIRKHEKVPYMRATKSYENLFL